MSTNQVPGAGQAIPPPRTAAERDSAFTVMMQGFIGLGRAGLAGDAVTMAKYQRILMKVQDIMARSRGAAVAGGGSPTDIERQDGVPTPVTGASFDTTTGVRTG
jgi:hypothetical protein